MATRPMNAGGGKSPTDWRAAFRRSLRRAMQLTGAVLLFAAMVFFALALLSYHQTDPSTSTAAGDTVQNWMGRSGAWVAERALFLFGPVSALFVPLLYAFSRKLWRDAEDEETVSSGRWWGTVGQLLLGMVLLATVLSLAFTAPGGKLPASVGGLAGLMGAGAIKGLASLLPEAGQGWAIFGAALACLGGGIYLSSRVFATDWASLLTLPAAFKRAPRMPSADDIPFMPRREKPVREARPVPIADDRKPPEISDPTKPVQPAQLNAKSKQKDLFDQYQLPGLDLLVDPPQNDAPKIDKLALERNARLLENVLDDFNVKGEITAVRTGPVVTMYELEPAPGIKASRVIGLAEDIARNMSAISARVSSIPGKTVMGIELPNKDRQVVAIKELMGCEAFVHHKGMLPIILGKDIAGEPIVADLAAMPHLLVAGTTGSGKSVGLNTILLSLLYRLTPAQCRLILVDPKVLELKSYD
ncbi:MAG: hypothetical protein RIS17_917, partial [Pseudomonadota bacterium]